ncbi:MAG: ergothioneine biosynthesis protein EgtB [Gemmatimonadota bacterium]|nr:ergothioneine biosynthesis protein EgtB [Gemmatimonadota bacterium]
MPATEPHPAPDKEQLAALLDEARRRTILLVSGLSDEDLHRQHDALMSPIIWDLGHIAHFEELWLTQNLDGPIEFSEMPGLYNPFEHPRASRAALSLPSLDEMTARMTEIRGRVLDRLETLRFDERNPLLKGALVYHMVLQHEYQHNETILQTLQLKIGEPYQPAKRFQIPGGAPAPRRMVAFPEGPVSIGTDDPAWSYDNERPRHEIHLAPFRIDVYPVTNGEFAEFIAGGGYDEPRHWSPSGREWLAPSGIRAPKYWRRDGDAWFERSMDQEKAIDPDRPVCHVCFYEAEAFAAWAGKRLPTEFEWEAAASWSEGGALAYPWGDKVPTNDDANVDQLTFQTAPVGAYARNVSPLGCYGMIGDVWEWTTSEFRGYPGFASYPYKEYSEEFFGPDYRVLRGGSWATRPHAIRNTFRNWDYPIRRQIFSGFRCASGN